MTQQVVLGIRSALTITSCEDLEIPKVCASLQDAPVSHGAPPPARRSQTCTVHSPVDPPKTKRPAQPPSPESRVPDLWQYLDVIFERRPATRGFGPRAWAAPAGLLRVMWAACAMEAAWNAGGGPRPMGLICRGAHRWTSARNRRSTPCNDVNDVGMAVLAAVIAGAESNPSCLTQASHNVTLPRHLADDDAPH